MNHMNQALRVALAAVEQLPIRLQRQLLERLVAASATTEENLVFVYLRRLSAQKQARLAKLMDKNNESRLTSAEHTELKQLGAETDRLLLANSEALARALRPELFDDQGRPLKSHFRQATRRPSFQQNDLKRQGARV